MEESNQKVDILQLLEVSNQLAEVANTEEEIFQKGLELVCTTYNWPVGHVYVLDEESEELVSSKIWYLENQTSFNEFRQVTEITTFKKSVGLPGRVYESKTPRWIVDVTKDRNFPRAKLAKEIGVRAGFAFPLLVRGEIKAVWEFFAAEAFEQDHKLISVISAVSAQIGNVFEKIYAEKHRVKANALAERSREMERLIRQETDEITDRNSVLESGMRELTDVMSTVNMIALNARIEAYRLGSESSSFVVVTNEMQRISEEIIRSGERLTSEVLELQKSNQVMVDRVVEVISLLREIQELQH